MGALVFTPSWGMNCLSVGISRGRSWRDGGIRGHVSVVILRFVTVGGGAVEIRRVSGRVNFVIVLYRSTGLVLSSLRFRPGGLKARFLRLFLCSSTFLCPRCFCSSRLLPLPLQHGFLFLLDPLSRLPSLFSFLFLLLDTQLLSSLLFSLIFHLLPIQFPCNIIL